MTSRKPNPLALFHPPVRDWFTAVFDAPTRPQTLGWESIARGDSTLVLAPTGTGKTLAAFLWAINRVMFEPVPEKKQRCRILYVSPIKALAVDVERNLRAPIVGIAHAARRLTTSFHEPSVMVRTGDTPTAERVRFQREPADILITTPESLYLLLTSNAREVLRSIETVIIDEIHALVPGKRGTHLSLSLERLEHLCGRPLQRIGLSATQRPLEEVSHFLGGVDTAKAKPVTDEATDELPYRPVTIVDASAPKRLDLRVEVPVEDMASLDDINPLPSGPASQGPVRGSIWAAIHPELLRLVQEHRSTLIFVNSRRLAERISGAINDLAGESLVRAHHGSVSVAQRKEIEDLLKAGQLRGIVATSSLELGIDMGAVDLVIQVEAPPSVASGMQRIGRASHQVGAVSKGLIFPKYRADLLACAAVTRAMQDGEVESIRYPRNPLDVLAQQIVAAVAVDPWNVDDLYAFVRGSAPFATLSRPLFDGVLDMLSGRYPSDEFAELRPRINWDRVQNTLTPRQGSKSMAIANGGTIPDRGLYGVFLSGAEKKGGRLGELDEEMVFESRPGETIILGATTWRIDDITHDRVLVSPAPGEPGKMPFWKGDAAGRPAEFGTRIGALTRKLLTTPRGAAIASLVESHRLDANAADNLMRYLEDQRAATEKVPSDKDILVERYRDELGDWRVCVLTPFGSRVHAPWCIAVTAKLRADLGIEPESMWTEDGFVVRLPDSDAPLDVEALFPTVSEFTALVTAQLGGTALFAGKFREAAGRALLLPRRRPGQRTALWQQRKKSADLLAVAARYSTFPLLLETYRECLRDIFDLTAATDLLRDIQNGAVQVTTVDSQKPSPFASSLLFGYIANYIYEGDAPLAERRAQALSIDQAQLQDLLGDVDFRELLDPAVLDEVEAQLQMREAEFGARTADALHDLLRRLGDLSAEELAQRAEDGVDVAALVADLERQRRVVRATVAGAKRYIAVEDAARYRDALGVPLPPGLPDVWLEPAQDALLSILRRYARTHGPFTTAQVAARFGVADSLVEPALTALHAAGKLLEGEFHPRGTGSEWCDPEVLRIIRRKTLARLRKEVEPVDEAVFARLITRWQGVSVRRPGLDAVLDAVELLQGAPIPASTLEREILPARVKDYRRGDLDTLIAGGEVVWVGVERLGRRDGRIALYTAQNVAKLLAPAELRPLPQLSELAQKLLEFLKTQGASFFPALQAASGAGFFGETLDALWELVWAGLVTNDTLQPLRALVSGGDSKRGDERKNGRPESLGRSRGRAPNPAGQGRWSLVETRIGGNSAGVTEWSAAVAQQLLNRYGILTREAVAAEGIPGGFSSVYRTLRAMEDSGLVRRGMFVGGLGGAQFAMNAAVDMLRRLRNPPEQPETLHLATVDPANPYGAILPWPRTENNATLSRTVGTSVVLVNGALAAYLRRSSEEVTVFLPENEPERSATARALAGKLAEIAIARQAYRAGLLVGTINGAPAEKHLLGRFLEQAGFVKTALGYQMRRVGGPLVGRAEPEVEEEELESDEAQID
ncbi:ATP dependent helicase, Lhr family [Candidatus Koribacter versatilis Ellin345]|uniref:ATP dependent helicase, Lhr family n=1 Tax=Koribacter versatilis (strain Ellin345) TaxID=204669 RepID=Q1IUR1_KORVE|nr:crosslink repair DNA glycosylase YcaQ family protein [Candidatus Koribacter versatilis]ABF39389.1 ATP dependent helicase, Lhr family [Candidatus Koribacter versatilis Ellin345]